MNQSDRRQFLQHLGIIGFATATCCGCKSAPMTGRRQLIFMPEGQEIALGSEAFQETMTTEQPSQDTRLSEMVNRVGQRIAMVCQRNDYQWEFKLIASPTQNAFCLPGGKVAIYEGILPVCEDEAGLAVVMSHEIAHALARHGGERMSQNMAVDGAKMLAEKLAGRYAPGKKELLMQAYGMGSEYGVLLPYSRKQESEADEIGLTLMAQAGFDPSVAPDFWTRFGNLKQDQTPEFLSTHPSDAKRADNLRELMPNAQNEYQRAANRTGRGERLV